MGLFPSTDFRQNLPVLPSTCQKKFTNTPYLCTFFDGALDKTEKFSSKTVLGNSPLMSKIIKISILGGVILVSSIIFVKYALAQESDNLKIIAKENILIGNVREKLGAEVVEFKTRGEEQLEKNNKKRLDIYKNRLAESKFVQGKRKILVTGYSSTPDQCWGNPFKTASGTRVHNGTMACPPQYPFGTKIKIEGIGTFVCEDRGGAIKGNHFDRWFTSRSKALAWGKRVVEAEIVK